MPIASPPELLSNARVLTAGLAFGLAACAPMVVSTPTRLEAAPSSATEIVVQRDVDFRLSTGFRHTLPASSRWRLVGRLPEGDVYRPVNVAFAVEGRQVHEAYLVVSGRTLRGFFLAAESSFAPLGEPIQLPLETSP